MLTVEKEGLFPIPNYEKEYLINETGEVYSIPRHGTFKNLHKMSVQLSYDGYPTVKLCKNGICKRHRVHRLVAETFIPNPKNLETVNHINEIKTDNRVENLEWLSDRDNRNYGTRIKRAAKSNCKPVVAVHSQTLKERYYESQIATKEDGFSPDCVNKVVLKKGKTHKNYYFFFEEEYKKLKGETKPYTRGKAIKAVDINTGDEEYYGSQREAVKTGKYTGNNINACLNGRRKTHKGKRWFFITNDLKEKT